MSSPIDLLPEKESESLTIQNTASLFQVEFDSTPSPNIPLSLPSGIMVKGIEMWLDLFIGMEESIDQAMAKGTFGC